MTDTDFEAMVNPDKFCFGEGAFNTETRDCWMLMADLPVVLTTLLLSST